MIEGIKKSCFTVFLIQNCQMNEFKKAVLLFMVELFFNSKLPNDLIQTAVADAFWSSVAEAFAAVFFVVRVASFKPIHLGISFEREDMCANTVQEPTVVGDDHRTSCKVFDSFF